MTAHHVRSYVPGVDKDEPPDVTAPAPEHYEVRIEGRLSAHWSAWFDGLEVVDNDDGTTLLRGAVADQAALHGLLHRLRDLGIPLRSLNRTSSASHPTLDTRSDARHERQ